MRLFLLFSFCLSFIYLEGQSFRAIVYEDYTMSLSPIELPTEISTRDTTFEQLEGFPIGNLGSPSFKNFRNVTLADLNQDGVEDILIPTNNVLRAFTGTGTVLWSKTMNGVGIYPPSVADINNDGQPEIVQVTGGAPANGRIYVMDRNGEDLEGWPKSLDNNWILTAPTLSDLDEDNLMEIIILERVSPAGNIHIFKLDGTNFNENWPITLDGTPAVTPSVGDVDGDGEKDIISYSINARYIFDLEGQLKNGFPLSTTPFQRYSFQSPILVDFEGDNNLEIVGATHGGVEDADPKYYIMNKDASDRIGWPIDVPNNNWTFSTPTVVEIDGSYNIFMSRPVEVTENPMLYGWDSDGNLLDGFPIVKIGGWEGIISVADIDNDDAFELVFGSELVSEGQGYIHAYELDGVTEVEGFPIRPRGFSTMNGAALGDVNGDGLMDLTALTYTLNFGALPDSVFLNVYNLNVPYSPEKILWSTYKGSNTRTGLIGEVITSSEALNIEQELSMKISPNPLMNSGQLSLRVTKTDQYQIELFDYTGKRIQTLFNGALQRGLELIELDLNNIASGMYFITVKHSGSVQKSIKLIKL